MAERAVCRSCGGKPHPGPGYKYCEACIEKRKEKPGCIKCGAPKEPRKPTQYCEDCLDLLKWATEKKRHFKPQRLCKKCGKAWVTGLKQYCEPCRNPVMLCQKCHSQPVRGFRKRLCELCYLKAREHQREYHRDWQREQREDPVERERQRAVGKAFRERLAKDQKRRDRMNETRRIWWRRIHGTKPLTEEKYLEGLGKKRARLPAEPLREVIEEYVSKGDTLNSLATLANVVEKRVREVYHGQTDTVLMSIADKICVTCGTTLEWVYDDERVGEEIPLDGDYGLDKAS